MPHSVEIKDNKATVTLTIPKEDVEQGMKHAAEHLAQNTKIDGFRPGKASYDVIVKRFGEMKVLEAASEELIRTAFVKAMLEENLETVGSPYFDVVSMAPGNDMVITAEIALYPHVTKLADIGKLSVKRNDTSVKPEAIAQAKKDLALMQTKEVRAPKDTQLKKGDKAVVNLTMKKDGVVLEGGEGQDHGIYTAEPHYIEGIVDKIVGAKEGETRTFTLKFPEDHYQKHLAGKDVDFEVIVNEIFHLEAPKMDDEFAKTVGLTSAKELEDKLNENLKIENDREEEGRLDKEVLDAVAEGSAFEEIPDLLLNQEIEKMIHELKHQITQQGMDFDQYLNGINKTPTQLKLDFTPTALKRIKVGIVLKELAKANDIKADEKKIDEELDKVAEQYEDKETKEKVYDPQYRDYVAHQLTNRAVIDWLKEQIVK